MRLSAVVLLVALMTMVGSHPTFVERIIYNGPGDYACLYGQHADYVDVTIYYDGTSV